MNSPTSATNGAVFLSYASQDAGAARGICETLRAAGIEVWFDQSELVGGDEWDAKIKRQIRECALFVPIISANTQSRSEGYFRREWNLAAQRLLDMAPGRPFLVPVAIDDTSERDALVAEEFLRMQWTRAPGGKLSSSSVARIAALLQAIAAGTNEAFSRMPRSAAAAAEARPPRWRLAWIGVAAMLAAASAFALFKMRTGSPGVKQVAVLPFKALGEEARAEAFCEGLAETITAQLTQLEQFQRALVVVPMSEVRKERVTSPSEARTVFASTLVLTGTVQRSDMLVRVTVNLIDAVTLRIVRSDTFDNAPTDLYRLQDRVAAQAAEWLGLDLSPEARRALAVGQTNVGSAYELYVQGQGELARRDAASNLDASIVHLQQALIADPNYALAHAALGEAFWRKYMETKERRWLDEARASCRAALQSGASLAAPHITLATLLIGTGEYEQAVAEAETALRLDPTSAEATRALARALDRLNRPAEAEAAFKRAIERSPGNPQPLTELATFCWRGGRMAEAEGYFLRVAELTPQYYAVYRNLGGLYVMMGRPEQAAALLEKSLTLRPTAPAYSNLGTLRFQQGRYADAATLFEQASNLSPREHMFVGNLGDALRYSSGRADEATEVYARAIRLAEQALLVNPKDAAIRASLARYYAFSGNTQRALAEVEQARALGPKVLPVTFNAAVVYERAGERDRALETLALAIKGGYSRTDISKDPDLKELRADGRFASLLTDLAQLNGK